ncbi:hypothetical protein Z949_1828 [Sulfitobacter guttiformis KCTC 32187]|nr:hypothetical protein Z949_1828 [Sulfitobacter guttiformis KCTC 32187]
MLIPAAIDGLRFDAGGHCRGRSSGGLVIGGRPDPGADGLAQDIRVADVKTLRFGHDKIRIRFRICASHDVCLAEPGRFTVPYRRKFVAQGHALVRRCVHPGVDRHPNDIGLHGAPYPGRLGNRDKQLKAYRGRRRHTAFYFCARRIRAILAQPKTDRIPNCICPKVIGP